MSSYLRLRTFTNCLLVGPARKASSTRQSGSSRRRVRPSLETLEDRITPTVPPIIVTDKLDDGSSNSLRAAIIQSNQDTSETPYTIQLQAGLYTLSIANKAGHDVSSLSGDLNINGENHDLVIEGTADANGSPTTIIQQTQADRVFQILDPALNPEHVTFKNLIITGGTAVDNGGNGTAANSTEADGGAIMATGGFVKLSNVVLKSNIAGGGDGQAAKGGGIFVGGRGSLTIQFSTIQGNAALGGISNDGSGGSGAGGGVYGSDANISISSSTLSNGAGGGASITNGSGGSGMGGDVFASGTNSFGSLTLTNCEFGGGTVGGGDSVGGGGVGGAAEGGDIFAVGISTTLNGCTSEGIKLQGGSSKTNSGGGALGGGVYSEGTLTIESSALSNNTLAGGDGDLSDSASISGDVGGEAAGGGVWSSGKTIITDTRMSGNTLTGGNGELANSSASVPGDIGGEALGGGGVVAGTSATISDCTVSDNTLTGGNGSLNSNGTVKGTFGGSAAGGGVYVSDRGGSTPTIAITDSTLSGNTLTGGTGAGGATIGGTGLGGGADLAHASNATIVNSTIANNSANGGVGAPNNPTAAGGGLFFGSTTTATLTNVTVVSNQANKPTNGTGTTSGGGIDNTGGKVTLVNTLVALNGAGLGPDFAGTVTNSDHNLISVADGSSGFSAAHGDQLGSEANFLNPKLGPLANNGGPTETIALLSGSPALNGGDNNAVSTIATAEGVSPAAATDQRGQGFPRVFGATIDIGAFEAHIQSPQQSPPAPSGSPPSPTPPPTLHTPSLLAFFDSLLAAVETVNSNGTETVTDSIFGIPLLVSTYDSHGDLMSVTIFGIDVTSLFESL